MDQGNDILSRCLWMLRQGYLRIDTDGTIWRCAAMRHGKWVAIQPRRAENTGNKGYLRVTIIVNGRLQSIQAHRLIWIWTHGKRIKPSIQINHKDLNKANNRPDNLEICTGAENIRHSYSHGRRHPWSDATEWRGRPRFTEEQIERLRLERRAGKLFKDLAKEFGISITHAHRLCKQGGLRERSQGE